jgi:hypothetical protein
MGARLGTQGSSHDRLADRSYDQSEVVTDVACRVTHGLASVSRGGAALMDIAAIYPD